ncbi:MAG: DUF1326 domain-containing protein [Rhodospirillales bacterium]|jgi:hypothetical protein|nr:DUF1326 domain-containing protein [Rhodospirillales bacterium]
MADWRLKGEWIKNCNCAFGCPCDFNARPTNGNCLGVVGMNILDGHHGDTSLSGLKFLVLVDFPGPLHEGHGTVQAIIDDSASQEQVEGLAAILSGEESEEGTLFNIFASITETLLDPIVAPIEFRIDVGSRTGKVVVPGVFETEIEPIKNPVTGAEHSIQIVMPHGFEHHGAEVASSWIKSNAGIKMDIPAGHASLTVVEQTPAGVAH